MIFFKKVRWKNFLSYGNYFTEIDLQKNATTLVVGKNGSGKSTLSDAITFALYNKPFRKIKKENLVNSINKKDCVIEIEFSVRNNDYKIVRGIKPNRFEIYRDGTLINQEASNRDYQDYLETQIIKVNFKTFSQIIILGSSSFVPFMRLTTPQRREVIEDLLDIQIFSSMNDILKERLKELDTTIREKTHSLQLAEKDKQHQEILIERANQNILEQIDKYKLECKEISEHIVKQQDKVDDYKKQLSVILKKGIIDELEETNERQTKISVEISTGASEISKEKKLFDFYSKHDNCPTCKQELKEEFRQDKMKEHETNILQIEESKESLNKDLEEANKVIASLKEEMKKAQDINSSISSAESALGAFKSSMKKRIKDIETLKKQESGASVTAEKKVLAQIQEKIDNLQKSINEAQDNKSLHKILETYFMKDTGIKTEIIKRYLPIMNQTIETYLNKMDLFVNFEIDKNFNEIIKSRHRDKFTYASFSEGEKQKIDIALLFTWREIAKQRNSINTNLLVLDEIADSSLDDQSTAELIKILKYQQDLNIFLISHKSGGDVGYDGFRSVLSIEKKNNFSRVK